MKDEEMAEEYAEKYFGKKTELVEVWKLKSCKESFLAGLKAGRPQWHDLRKDPNDLPEKMGTGSKEVYISYDDKVTDFAYYCFDEKLWRRSENEETLQGTVIAWCEIPTFDKE